MHKGKVVHFTPGPGSCFLSAYAFSDEHLGPSPMAPSGVAGTIARILILIFCIHTLTAVLSPGAGELG